MTRHVLNASLVALLFAAAPALAHSGHGDVDRDRSHIRPSDAQRTVVIDNEVGRAVTVYADGRKVEVLRAGERARLRVRSDTRVLEARVGSRRIARFDVDGPEVLWRLVRPTETAVLVTNPLPIDVVVSLGGERRDVSAGASVLFAGVDVGSATLVARRGTGQVVDRDTVRLSAFDDFRWEVEAPETGLVRVLNRWSSPLEVELDGEVVGVIEPGQSRTFEAGIGWTDVELTRLSRAGRRGAEVLDTVVRVQRYDTEQVVTGPNQRSRHHTHPARPTAR